MDVGVKQEDNDMTTRITENGITVLVPNEGMRLTNGETIADGEVYLSGISSPNNWQEITVEEAQQLIDERRRKEEESIAAQ